MDRRFLWAIILMIVIAIVPSFIFKPSGKAVRSPNAPGAVVDSTPAPAEPPRMSAPVGPLPEAAVGAPQLKKAS
jgi:hypothetical protein